MRKGTCPPLERWRIKSLLGAPGQMLITLFTLVASLVCTEGCEALAVRRAVPESKPVALAMISSLSASVYNSAYLAQNKI